MTGVYHGWDLERGMKNSKHVIFTMGSHFVLLEWPDLVAEEIIELVMNGNSDSNDTSANTSTDNKSKGKKKTK
jgi:hypothetical protein